ncbi:MAG: alpha/beta fold hydrolase [Solirubrobacteraceae bacterium]
MGVDEHTIEVAGEPVFYRRAPTDGATALLLHSVPTSADDWNELLPLTGGVAVDLPGFGRSGKGGQIDYSMDAYVEFLERFLRGLSLDRVVVVGHGWGAAFGLQLAMRYPQRVAGLALMNPVPLLEGFRWPRAVGWWRRPVIGELLMGSVNRRVLARTLRGASASAAAWPDARVQPVWEQFDQGTQRAILRLHRSVQPGDLERAGLGLAAIEQPTLIVWGDEDPWLQRTFADAYARRIPNAALEHVSGAGHWPWLDHPELLQRLAAFVDRP